MDVDREAVCEHVWNAGIVFGLWKTKELGFTVAYRANKLSWRGIRFLVIPQNWSVAASNYFGTYAVRH